MFNWFKTPAEGSVGLAKMTRDLERMINEGRHEFDSACSVLIGGADPDTVRSDLLATDKRINRLEQSIRRQILVHGSVHGSVHLPEMMVLMSVAKDAERIGDYAKNLFALSEYRTFPSSSKHHKALREVRERTSSLLADAPELYETQDKDRATEFLDSAFEVIHDCEARMVEVFKQEVGTGQDAAAVLAFRYMRRVAGHIHNVITAVVNPVDKLDFYDEPTVDE